MLFSLDFNNTCQNHADIILNIHYVLVGSLDTHLSVSIYMYIIYIHIHAYIIIYNIYNYFFMNIKRNRHFCFIRNSRAFGCTSGNRTFKVCKTLTAKLIIALPVLIYNIARNMFSYNIPTKSSNICLK